MSRASVLDRVILIVDFSSVFKEDVLKKLTRANSRMNNINMY